MYSIKLGVAVTFLLLATQVQATPITSGLQLWLDASDSSTVFDISGLTPGQAGFDGNVALWSDKSGNSRDAASATASSPTYDSTGMNGMPTITFGGDVYFDLASTISSSEETVFIVTRMFTNGDNEGPWLGNSNDLGGHGVPGAFFNDRNRYFVATADGLFGFVPASAPTSDTIVMELRSICCEFNPVQVTVSENGSTVLSGLPVPGTMNINTVGWFPFQNRFFYGEISEILYYNRALSGDEVTAMQTYLADKYINTSVPEPTTLALLGLGLAGLGLSRLRPHQ